MAEMLTNFKSEDRRAFCMIPNFLSVVLLIQTCHRVVVLTIVEVSSLCDFETGCEEVLVVVGGFGHQQSPIDAVEKYDPKLAEWQSLPVRS